MSSPILELLRARRFGPLFVSQFCGAINDNLLKSALGTLLTYRLAVAGGFDAQTLVMIASAAFIAPYFLFSALAGGLADRFDKAVIARWIKVTEVAIMAIGGIGLMLEHVAFLIFSLFLLGVHSTAFGPIKYALLPQHLRAGELVAGNALVEAGTFLGILVGMIVGGLFVLGEGGTLNVSVFGVFVASIGLAAAFAIPAAPPPGERAELRWNIVADSIALVRYAASRPVLLRSMLLISWFWLFGATYVAGLPVFAKETLHASEQVYTLMLCCFAVGIAIGSLLAERLLRRELSARLVPIAGLAIAFFCWRLFVHSDARPTMGPLVGAAQFLTSWDNLAVVLDLLAIAIAGGVFTVPLYAIMQAESEPTHRARVVAANNILNAVFMTLGAVLSGVVLATGMTMAQVFLATGLLTAVVALIALWILREDVLKATIRRALQIIYRVELNGLDNVLAAGPRAVIAANHASFLDGVLLAAFLPGRPVFAIDTFIARKKLVRPFLRLFDAMPVDPTNPLSIRQMIRAVESGRACVIFPEGRITVTGALMKVYEGPAVIADKAKAPLVPVRIEGAEYSPFSRLGDKVRRRWFPKISITVLPARAITAPAGTVGRARRRLLGAKLYDEMTRLIFDTASRDTTLFDALLAARAIHGSDHPVIDDIDRKAMDYGRLITATHALAKPLAAISAPGERVGVLLPNARGAVVTFFALQATGRVPAMLNFTTGQAALLAACAAAEIKTILTSRRFVERAKLEPLIDVLAKKVTIVHLEDLRERIGVGARLAAALRARFAKPQRRTRAEAEAPAVVLFTSGSEGTPKGVVLSHLNLLSNRHQLGAVVDFTPRDLCFNALPLFHSFGLTGGLLLPLLAGVRIFLYPSPLHYRIVPELAYDVGATILFGTDTFLAGYARVADAYDFYSVRYVFAGAERVKPETRRIWVEKFGLRILEGYGTTETSPVLAVNTPMRFRAGTVGRLLPAIEHRLDHVEGINEGGRLVVRGPNVMLGYLRAEKPGVIQPPDEGWYDTGDIVTIDAEGYVTIRGRAKRFAKIAGEMIPLGAVEELASSLWPMKRHACVAIADARRGEQLVLASEEPGATREALLDAARKAGMPEIFVPRVIVPVDTLPLLGTGKTDYVTLTRLVVERFTAGN
jgi:acyl-[acyl-carrier-protein]-phospholipid O-acyltransferase/long-chain-fatty-acid--[acyl-carrier-protein] ligase